jgi:hypothetical protein
MAVTPGGATGPTEDSVYHMICLLQGRWEVIDKRDIEVLQLLGQSLKEDYEYFSSYSEPYVEPCTCWRGAMSTGTDDVGILEGQQNGVRMQTKSGTDLLSA